MFFVSFTASTALRPWRWVGNDEGRTDVSVAGDDDAARRGIVVAADAAGRRRSLNYYLID